MTTTTVESDNQTTITTTTTEQEFLNEIAHFLLTLKTNLPDAESLTLTLTGTYAFSDETLTETIVFEPDQN